MTQLATIAEYARLRGCSRQAIEKAAAKGRITLIDSPKGRLVDIDQANIEWAARTDSTQQHRGAPGEFAKTQRLGRASSATKRNEAPAGRAPAPADPPAILPGLSLIEEKTRSERLRIEKQELDLAERRGELVSRHRVVAALSSKLISAAETLQGLPDRLAAVFAAETDAGVIHRTMTVEIRAAMAAIAIVPDQLH